MLKRLANQYLLLITYYFRTAALRLSNQNPSPPAPLLPLLSSPESMLIQPDLISLPFNSLSIVLWQQACF